MTTNLFTQFRKLFPSAPLLVGDVVFTDGDVATIELPGGGQATARGAATVGQKVFFRDGAIEGVAPDLPFDIIEV